MTETYVHGSIEFRRIRDHWEFRPASGRLEPPDYYNTGWSRCAAYAKELLDEVHPRPEPKAEFTVMGTTYRLDGDTWSYRAWGDDIEITDMRMSDLLYYAARISGVMR